MLSNLYNPLEKKNNFKDYKTYYKMRNLTEMLTRLMQITKI